MAVEALVPVLRSRHEPTVVEELRDEPADIWMKAPCLGQEQSFVRTDCCTLSQQMGKNRDIRSRRMDTLLRLIELLRIANEDETAGCLRNRQRVGEGHLARLVHEEHVHRARHVIAGPHPGCSGHYLSSPVP